MLRDCNDVGLEYGVPQIHSTIEEIQSKKEKSKLQMELSNYYCNCMFTNLGATVYESFSTRRKKLDGNLKDHLTRDTGFFNDNRRVLCEKAIQRKGEEVLKVK